MDAAHELFDRLVAGGAAAIRQAVDEQQQETLLLDFKTAEKNAGPLTKADRRHYAEALSGFANSDGGVVVWGVYAKALSHDGPDVAQEVRPIGNLKRFLSDLEGLAGQLVSPGVEGVHNREVPESDQGDRGCVLTLIPRSETATHMAIGPDQHRFYYRSGSSFLAMESFMVADRLGRRPQPRLELSLRTIRGSVIGGRSTIDIVLGIRNTGRGVALYPAVVLQETQDLKVARYGLDGNGNNGLPRRPRPGDSADRRRAVFAGGADHAIHPGSVLEVTRLETEVALSASGSLSIEIQYELYCDGFAASGTETISL